MGENIIQFQKGNGYPNRSCRKTHIKNSKTLSNIKESSLILQIINAIRYNPLSYSSANDLELMIRLEQTQEVSNTKSNLHPLTPDL